MFIKCQELLSKIKLIGVQDPNRVAIYWQTKEISYGELWNMVLAEANYLPEEPSIVAIHLGRSPRLVAILLACWLKGHVYCALDPKHPEKRKNLIVENLQPNVWISDDNYNPIIANNIDITVPKDLAYILYTSGSTGQPKGVMVSEHSVQHLLYWACGLYSQEQLAVILASTTITFDLSVFELFVPLMAGTSIALVNSILDLVDISPDTLPPISLLNTVPSAIREISRVQAIPKTCQVINLAGEALDQTLVNELYAHKSVKVVYNLWGPSEDTTYSTAYLCRQGKDLPQAVPIGQPLPETEVILSNNEIILSGPGVCLGYWNRPDLDDQCFGISESGKRFYRTGDLGYWDEDQQLRFLGRKDFQVKIRGYRIEIEDIEAQSYKIPHIREAVVSIIEKNNMPTLALLAYSDNRKLAVKRLKQELSKFLPHYMVPELIDILYKPLEKTPNGKLCRKQAKLHWLVAKPLLQKSGQKKFIQIAESILNCHLDPKESFIDQGGNSLLAVQFKYALQMEGLGNVNIVKILDSDTSLEKLESILHHHSFENIKTMDLRALVDKTHWRAWQIKGSAYHVAVNCSINGVVDVNRLTMAIEKIILEVIPFSRQFYVDNIKLDTTSHSPKVLTFPANKDNHEQLLQHIQELVFEKPFDLNKEPCIRFVLIHSMKLTNILICAPHFILDGYGLEAMLKFISLFYSGKEMMLSNDQSIIRTTLKKPSIEEYLKKVNESYGGVIFPSQSMNDTPINQSFWLNKQQKSKLNQLARQTHMSQASFTLGLFQLLLHYCFDYKTMITAVPLANRYHDELNRINNQTVSIPVLSEWCADISLEQFLRAQNQQLISLIDEAPSLFCELENNQSDNSLFDIFFSTMDFAYDALQIDNCSTNLTFYNANNKKAPLVCSMITQSNGEIECRMESLSNRLSSEELTSFSQCYQYLLENIDILLDVQLSELSLLPKLHYELIEQLNQPQICSSDSSSLCSEIQKIIEVYSNRVAISDNNLQLTYEQLRKGAQQIATYLNLNGIIPGQGVGILLDRGVSCVITILGILWAGCHYVPIDKRNPKSRRDSIISGAEISFIIDSNILEIYKKLPIDFNIAPKNHPLGLAYIIFTSGTTGKPKGVPIKQTQILSLIASTKDKYKFDENDKWTMFHSYAFDFSVWEIFAPLLTGGEVCVVAEDIVNNPVNMIDFINKNKITVFNQTPTALKNILQVCNGRGLIHKPRLIFFGGEALTKEIIEQWFSKYGTNSKLVNMYGITEVTVHASEYIIDPGQPSVSIGKPMYDMGWQLRGQLGQLMPIGFPGELWISGVGVSDGYWCNPKLSNEKFIELDGQRFYRSGDLAWFNAEGLMFYIGRKDQQFQLNGYRLEKGDIINTIKTAEPFIQQIELVIVDTDNSGLSMLYAYYLSDKSFSETELTNTMSSWLPSYAMPNRWIQLKSFPLTINGKIDISALPKPDNILMNNQADLKKVSIAEKITACWEVILGYPVKQSNQAFFELGGNSLKAVRLSQEIAQLIPESQFTVVDVFRYPTLNQQIDIVKQRIKELIHV